MVISKKLSIVILVFLFSSNIHAALIGEDINGQLSASGFGSLLNQNSTVVSPGIEFLLNSRGPISADISDTSLNLNIGLGLGSDSSDLDADMLWEFTLTNPDLIFTQVVETFDDFAAGAVFNGISNAGKTISFGIIANQTITAPGHNTIYDLTIESTPSPVPAPTAIWLFGSGLIGLIGMRKKSVKLLGKYA